MDKQIISAFLSSCKEANVLRTVKPLRQQGVTVEVDGKKLINLSSNDYLLQGHDENLRSEFLELLNAHPEILFSAASSRLLTGTFPEHALFEEKVGAIFNKACLLLNSGFDANSGILPTLASKGTLFLADKLVHASIIDGLKASEGKWIRFPHNNLARLEALLIKNYDAFNEIIIVTEAVFSMDGDAAPLNDLILLKDKYPKIKLYIDEAHSFGVFGSFGLGLCEQCLDKIDYLLCTLGKAAGSFGAFFLSDNLTKDYLINNLRPFIFTTALPPVNVFHALFMVEKLLAAQEKRQMLLKNAALIRKIARNVGFDMASSGQIIPLVVGSNEAAVWGGQFFKDRGFYVLPIRHPTVPLGSARLRLSLCAGLGDKDIQKLGDTIIEFKRELDKKYAN